MNNLSDRLFLLPNRIRNLRYVGSQRHTATPVTSPAKGGSTLRVQTAWASTILKPNLGDQLTPRLVEGLLGLMPRQVSLETPKKLLAVGSIVEHALPGDFVWGTGSLGLNRISGEGVRFFAVRGPRTKALIDDADVPSVFGDPASLLPFFYQPTPLAHPPHISLVPHYVDRTRFLPLATNDTSVVNVRSRNLFHAIDLIANAELVISSSLHGLIIAEAYGVPTVWVEPSEEVLGGEHKFLDYFEGNDTSRSAFPISLGLADLERKAVPAHTPSGASLLAAGKKLAESITTAHTQSH